MANATVPTLLHRALTANSCLVALFSSSESIERPQLLRFQGNEIHTHTHLHIFTYLYISIYVCVFHLQKQWQWTQHTFVRVHPVYFKCTNTMVLCCRANVGATFRVFFVFFFLAHWLRCLRVLANIATFLFYIFCCNIALDCLKITTCTEYFFKFFYAILFGFYTSWLYVALLPPVVPTYWSMCVFLCIVFSTFLHWSRCCLYRFEKSRNEMRSTI